MPKFAKEKALQDPTGFALRDPDKSLTWSEVDEALNRAANLIIEADLGEERRVAVFAENAAETALAHLGALLGGASSVPVNFHLNADEAAYILADSETRILFLGPATFDRGIDAAKQAGVPTVVCWGIDDPAQHGAVGWDDWLAAGSTDDPPDAIKARPNLLYTSGTTGRPKGTELPPTMFAGGETMPEHLEGLNKSRFAQMGTHLVVGPMYHTGPLSGMRLLAAGKSSVILAKFDAENTLATIQEHKTESAIMVPTHFVRLLALPQEVKDRYDVSSMVSIAHTGAKCPVDVKRAMIEWFGPVFTDAYGASEVGTVCAISSEEWMEHQGSVGRALPPFTAMILDDDNNPLPPNTEGRLFFEDATGRGIIYPNDPAKTEAAHIRPGVFTIGEIGYMDEDGFVYLTDRFNDMVVSGGVNIYPAEAEQTLIEHPAVADVACIGLPHDEMGEELKALVILEADADPIESAELIAWCRERLTHYKCPRSVEFVGDITRNTMGKINKRKLRDAFIAGDVK